MGKRVLLTLINHLLLISLTCYGCSLSDRNQTSQIGEEEETTFEQSNSAQQALIRKYADPLSGAANDYDPLMKMIGDARFVLLGEATHGTHEFYRERAKITRRLIEEKGFDAVVLEADWTDAYRVNQFVLGKSQDSNAEQSLAEFTRFPRWMWRNTDFRDLVSQVRSINNSLQPSARKAGIYGMDLYGLTKSADAVIEYLNSADPSAGERARKRYDCFRNYRDRPEQYGYAVVEDERKSCEDEAAEQFQEMERRFAGWLSGTNQERNDDLFSAYQNARVVKNAEAYYRLSYKVSFSTWNLRDSHMAETLKALAGYLDAIGNQKSKIVVWAHNTHQGDARMTEMGDQGELNVGHLMRESYDVNAVLVGFTTYTGEVMAASKWGEEGRRMKVNPAIAGSYSHLFNQIGRPNFLLIFRGNEKLTQELSRPRLERAIGVIYLPQTERQSHYFEARMAKQFDAVIHFNVTNPVTPLN
ncbi:MAG: erythromycin esterase family protein [Acidobacteriota bacterium]|nr:erythromycin esterase family protein [Acidobacteriota bacterium]